MKLNEIIAFHSLTYIKLKLSYVTTRAPRVGALYAQRISSSINKWWKLYLGLTSAFICSSSDCNQSSYQVQWLSLKLFQILSGHVFCINATVTLTFDLKLYRGHLLSMTNLPTKYHDCHSETFQDIERTWFLHKMLLWLCYLTYWPQNI